MKLITNKSKNLLYRISSDSNTTIQFSTSYAVVTQTIADTASLLYFKLQGYKSKSQSYTNIFSGERISSTGVFTKTFTTPSTTGFDLIRFGLNGAKYDTCANCDMDLKPSTTYTFTCNFTNITQGSVSWKDMMLVEGSTAGEYEPYSYNLLDKWKYPATQTVNGVTFTNNGDGSWTVNGVSTNALYYNLQVLTSIPKGHKIIINDYNTNLYFFVDMLDSDNKFIGTIPPRTIYTLPDNLSKMQMLYYINKAGRVYNNEYSAPSLYDLTLMYGEGKEPTTVDQFYADHPELKVSPLGFIGLKNLEISNKNIKRLRYTTTTKNLFDKSRAIKGFELNSNHGGTIANLTWFVSDYISVVGINTLTISGKVSGGASNCFYDNNHNFISAVIMLNGAFQVPSGATYMRFNGLLTEIDTTQLESGSIATPYVPYGYLDLGILPSNSGYILDKYNNLSEVLLEENIEKDNISYHIPDKTNILLNKVEGKTNKIVQLADKSKYDGTSTNRGITFTNNGNGTITINGTNDGTDYSNHTITNSNYLTNDWLKGRKYLFYFSDKTDLNYYAVIGGSTSKIEYTELGNTSTGRSPLWKILSPTDNSIGGNSWYILRVKQNAICTNELASPQVFDLTAMYGFGNEPTTVEQFKKDYPQFFDEKLDGVWDAAVSGISTTGKNLFDIDSVSFFTKDSNGEYKSNKYIYTTDVLWTPKEGTNQVTISGYMKSPVGKNYRFMIVYTDGTQLYRDLTSTGDYVYQTITSDSSKTVSYIGLTYGSGSNEVYIKDIQIEESSNATSYEPYTENKIDFLSTQTLNGINGVNDYIEVIDKGNGLYDLKKTQNIDSVDLGTLDWVVDGSNFSSSSISSVIKISTNDSVGNYVCQKYVNCTISKSFVDGDFGVNSSGHIYFRNSAYTTAAAFKTAMNGVILYYQLKTPVTTTIATNLTYNQVSAIRTNGGLLLVNDNSNQKYVQPDVTIKENYQYKN